MSEEYELPDVPVWVFDARVESVVGSEVHVGYSGSDTIVKEALAVVPPLARLERILLEDAGKGYDSDTPSVSSSESSNVHVVCLAKMLLGACCEAFLSMKSTQLATPGTHPRDTSTHQMLARMYKDSCCAATWTSAHAQYLHDLLTYKITSAGPSIHSVPSECCEVDLSELYSQSTAARRNSSPDSEALLVLMTRCTNPAARGWNSVLSNMLTDAIGTRRIVSNALLISLTGMHSCIHPASRLNWKDRLSLLLHFSIQGLFAQTMPMCNNPLAFKECVRRMVSNTTSSAYANNAALKHLEHPVSFLTASPFDLPLHGLEVSCLAFAEAGRTILQSRGATDVQEAINSAFKAMRAPCTSKHSVQNEALAFTPGYLGKGTASVHSKVPATSVVSATWSMAFRCNFIPFWSHSASLNTRAIRIDAHQHNAIHAMNAATKLTLVLTDAERMAIQRLALAKPSAGLMTIQEVSSAIGIPNVKGSSCNGGSKGPIDTICTLADAGAKGAACILQFCRTAHLLEDILIYDLGERTKNMHIKALYKRVLSNEVYGGADTAEQMQAKIPEHASHLIACVTCKRVSNAMATDSGCKWGVNFSELGTSCTMMETDAETMETSLRCAKRSSASFKTASAFEKHMSDIAVESLQCNARAISAMCVEKTIKASGIPARVRRDCKSAMEQRSSSLPCGLDRMLSIPIVGRAVRLWNEWYTLCVFCGCCIRFYPCNRFHTHICCLRCDYMMLNRKNDISPPLSTSASVAAPICRYCGRSDPQRSGAKWRLVKSPLDESGENANKPPPLRTVYFCPKHFRSWIPACMKTMQTRIILSHIVYGAKPCYDPLANNNEQATHRKNSKKRKRVKLTNTLGLD